MAKLLNQNLRTEWCKSCAYCVDACPQKALSIGDKLNAAGFAYVALDESRCVGCGVCRLVCGDYVFRFVDEEA